MTPRDTLSERLLSHRLRGFDVQESTRHGLERALLAGVRNVEFDVRVSRDGCPVAYHDPFFEADDGTWRYVDDLDLAALRQQRALCQLATLEEMCASFARLRGPHALLHVDLKAVGHEAVVHDTIAKFGLLPHTILVSWLPDVLFRFHALSPQTRLCFSHLSMARAQWLYRTAKALSPLILHAAPAVSWGLRGIAPRLANRLAHEISAVRLHFDDDGDPAAEPSGADQARLFLGHVVPGVLGGAMLDLLRKTAGMVCVPRAMATPALVHNYRSHNIQLALYSVSDMRSLMRVVADIDPDIVYVDNADVIRRVAVPPALTAPV